jgi:hypothetical protein
VHLRTGALRFGAVQFAIFIGYMNHTLKPYPPVRLQACEELRLVEWWTWVLLVLSEIIGSFQISFFAKKLCNR